MYRRAAGRRRRGAQRRRRARGVLPPQRGAGAASSTSACDAARAVHAAVRAAGAAQRDRAAHAGGRGDRHARHSRACTTCATRSPPRPARTRSGIAPRRDRAQGLTAFRPYTGRLQVKQAAGGATLIDDSYNANPGFGARRDRRARRLPGADACSCWATWARSASRAPEFHAEVGALRARAGHRAPARAGRGDARMPSQAFGAGRRATSTSSRSWQPAA